MPRIKLTKTAIDDLSTPHSDLVYWDATLQNGKAHMVHLSAPALALLHSVQGRDGLVFPSSGKSFNAFSRAKRELDDLCGVTSWRLHDLRRPAYPVWRA